MPGATMRIGELASRTGISEHVLRVWERRYGLLTPTRSTGGYRLYGPSDERRVRETVRLRDTGMSTSQAAATALALARQGEAVPPADVLGATDEELPTPDRFGALRDQLLQAAGDFDETAAHAAVDTSFEELGVEESLREVVLPALREIGDRWADGTFLVAHEHFVSHVIRSRLSALALTWDQGTGPLAVLACPPGELHELGLLAFGVVLSRAGWRVRYLGANTPVDTLAAAVLSLRPELVVLSAAQSEPLVAAADQLAEVQGEARRALQAAHLVVAGAGATAELARRLGARRLDGDPVEVALRVTSRGGRSSGRSSRISPTSIAPPANPASQKAR